jgi:hypothetical protein
METRRRDYGGMGIRWNEGMGMSPMQRCILLYRYLTMKMQERQETVWMIFNDPAEAEILGNSLMPGPVWARCIGRSL